MEIYNKEGMVIARMRAPRLSCQQFDVLIKFMKAHPHFAAGRAGGSPGLTTREEHDMWWHQLTNQLNAAVGPSKSINKWQKCWVDLKSNARGRVAKIRAALVNPALDPVTPALTQWDHQVLSLMGPAYSDILAMCKPRRDPLSASETTENNSNSSFHDHEQSFQDNSLQDSPALPEENGHHSSTSNAAFGEVKKESEEDHGHLIFEEVECDIEEDAGYAETLPELYNPLGNGVSPRLLSPSVTVSPVTVPLNRQANISFVSSSTTHQARQIPVYSEVPSSRKRKSANLEEENEAFDKLPRGTINVLERLATAAEESNALQRQVVVALNKLSDSFAEIVPLVKHFSTNASTSKRKS